MEAFVVAVAQGNAAAVGGVRYMRHWGAVRPICLLLQSARLPACRRHEHASPELRKYNGSKTSTAARQVSLGAEPGRAVALVVDAASRGGEQQGTAATVVNMTATGHVTSGSHV